MSQRRAAADCGRAARGCGGGGRRPPPPPYLVMRPATGSAVRRLQPCADLAGALLRIAKSPGASRRGAFCEVRLMVASHRPIMADFCFGRRAVDS